MLHKLYIYCCFFYFYCVVLAEGRQSSPNDPNRDHPGFLQPILQFNKGESYQPHHFKYVVVPVGSGAMSTSGLKIL